MGPRLRGDDSGLGRAKDTGTLGFPSRTSE